MPLNEQSTESHFAVATDSEGGSSRRALVVDDDLKHVPIIAVSGVADMRIAAYSLRAVASIHKPLTWTCWCACWTSL
jgi:hypothetical protein